MGGLLRKMRDISTKGCSKTRDLAREILRRGLPCPLRKLNSIFHT